ncbi:hypothetical protein [Desulfobacterium sp. N47]|uniref:Uncharacterized protein n=1 Tax=uncultured Desulfobacterium sp. TaxID=201089 RepID=E1YJ19_9BACT|nr:unknown protein [uncultured Desulfobacterium sp.]
MQKHQKKLILIESTSNYSEEAGLDMISKIIDSTPNITDYVMQDLIGAKYISRIPGL